MHIQFHRCMYIPDIIPKPVIAITTILWSFSLSIINRVAVEIFVGYHTFSSGETSKEIKNLTEAVRLMQQLERADNIEKIHNKLVICLNAIDLGKQQRTYSNFVMNDLRNELKIHRTSIQCLYRGVAANEHLTNLIWSYCKHPESPGHKASQTQERLSVSTAARRLNFDKE